MSIAKSIDGHNIFYSAQTSTDSISFYPNGTRGNLFIEFVHQPHRGQAKRDSRALFRTEVEYLIVALQQHLEETKDGTPWWEMSQEGTYPNAASNPEEECIDDSYQQAEEARDYAMYQEDLGRHE